MTNKSWSPSELVVGDDCLRKHEFSYNMRIKPIGLKRAPQLASGTSVHKSFELNSTLWSGQVPPLDDQLACGIECLEQEFESDDDGGVKNVKKFSPGVKRAVERIPAWMWEATWHLEEDITGEFFRVGENFCTDCNCGFCKTKGETLKVHGRPDMYRVFEDEEGTPMVEIVDLKTTDNDPLQFLLWSPQLRMYAAMLRQQYPDHVIQYRYVCVPTGVSAQVPYCPAFIFTKKSEERTIHEMWDYRDKLVRDKDQMRPRFNRSCTWCDYSPICTADILGGDMLSVIAEMFEPKGERYDG